VVRVASLTAEPTLALAIGSEPMIASVAGAIAVPMPKPAATIVMPLATTTFVPSAAVMRADSGPPMTSPAATGSVRRPASSAS
jgi:hypothetical protein